MDSHAFLISLVTFLAATVIFVPIFRWLKLGAIIGYLAAGITIGPFALGLITDVKTLFTFSEMGVVFLLFVIGLELQPARLWKMRFEVFGYGSVQMFLTAALLVGPFLLLGFDLRGGIIVALALSLSSTAFALQMLNEKKQLKTLHGQSAFSILLFQDISVVPLLALVAFLAPTSSGEPFGLTKALIATGVLVGLVLAGRYLFRPVFRWVAESRTQEVFTATVLLVVVGVALVMEHVGLSMALGAFIAGVILANSEYRHEIEINIEPFKGLLLGLFFMTVGMALDFNALIAKPHIVLAVLGLLLIVKFLAIFATGKIFKLTTETSRNVASTLFQGGEFAFVLFTVASANGLLTSEWTAVLSAAVTVSMALTPAIFAFNQKFLRTFSEISERPYDSIDAGEVQVIIAGFGRYGQIVSRLMKLNKVPFTALEHSASQVDTARKFGTKIYYGDARRKEIIEAAHGHEAKVFVLAIDDVQVSVETAKMVKKNFPNLEIMARVRNREHAIQLLKLGINNVHRETYDSSLTTAKDTLMHLGIDKNKIEQIVETFKTHDHNLLRDQVEQWGNEKGLISLNNQMAATLESILKGDEQTGIEPT